jgi:hypothetical protein
MVTPVIARISHLRSVTDDRNGRQTKVLLNDPADTRAGRFIARAVALICGRARVDTKCTCY